MDNATGCTESVFHQSMLRGLFIFDNIYIFIAFALDESVILDVLQFPMKYIYQSHDLGLAIGQSNIKASQLLEKIRHFGYSDQIKVKISLKLSKLCEN